MPKCDSDRLIAQLTGGTYLQTTFFRCRRRRVIDEDGSSRLSFFLSDMPFVKTYLAARGLGGWIQEDR